MNPHIRRNAVKMVALAIAAGMVLSLSGCKQDPDSIIKNKDMDKLIDEAGNKENAKVGMDELVEQYDAYQTTVKDDTLKVTLNIDAKVSIPQTEKMSVIRVTQTPISEELIGKVRKALCGDTQLYDGTGLMTRTKKVIEREMKLYRDQIAALAADQDQTEEAKQGITAEYQEQINRLEEEYKTAPADAAVQTPLSDDKLCAVSDAYKRDNSSEYYSWMYSMDKSIQSYYGVSDGANNNYVSLSALNSADYGNRVVFRKGSHGYEFTASVMSGGENVTRWEGAAFPAEEQASYTLCPEDTARLSKEDAVGQADAFLQQVGITDFAMYEGELYTEAVDVRYQCDLDGTPCRTYYVLKYMRNIGGAFVTASGLDKHNESWDGNSYVKQNWPEESIELRINDNGIVGFDYNAPVKETETVVEDSALQSFAEIKKTFEKMAVIANAQQETATVLTVNRVVFGYSRISEKDSFDTGLLVPVWDFFGKSDSDAFQKEGADETILMTINAIDGSVIDREIGY